MCRLFGERINSKIFRTIQVAVIITVFAALSYYLFFTQKSDIEKVVKDVIPQAEKVVVVNKEPLIYEGINNDTTVGYAVLDKATGYQSNIKIMTGVNTEGIITGVYVVEQQETPAFFRQLVENDFFEQFLGREIQRGFSEGNIDVIGGATISSSAVIKAVNSATNYAGKNYLELPMPKLALNIFFGLKEIFIALLILIAVYATYSPKAKLRTFCLIFSIFVLGFFYKAFITNGALALLLTAYFPNPLENISWYFLVGGAFLLILFTGKNIFCFWICPFGSVQELLAKVGGMSYIPGKRYDKLTKYIPGFFLWLSLVFAFLSGNPAAASYEPFAVLFSQMGSYIQWILLLVVLLASLFIFRFWCNYFCPVGFTLNLWAKLRRRGVDLWRKKVRKIKETISS
ncbi:MAG: hypothetical protein JM58_01940 [Peptococcaceae bacterium BICA1-8]|nr:MAG: hypothetical protein JM58_01940 [Peptococcaceae bacterium BICA1-8]